jgi:hypothetical protein
MGQYFLNNFLQTFQFEYTVGPEFKSNPYHIDIIRGTLTRNLGRCFPRVRDEIVHAFDDVIGVRDTGLSSLARSGAPSYSCYYIQNGN